MTMSQRTLFPTRIGEKRIINAHVSRLARLFFLLVYLITLMAGVPTSGVKAAVIDFTGEELLGRPTDTSITVKVVPDENIELFYDYGTTSGSYPSHTATTSATSGQPHETVISGLTPNTQYYYRMQYRTSGDPWIQRPEHSFRTQRAQGSTFTFTITSDSHVNILLGNASTWTNTLNDVAADHPDFSIDLGDTVAMRSVDAGDVA
jgi:hypothetical protein